MSIVTTIARAGYEFIVISVIAMPFVVANPWTLAWYALCVFLAFVLRMGIDYNRSGLTSKAIFYQSICTIGWVFFMMLVWDYFYSEKTKGFELYLFVNSLFATFMVGQFDQVFRLGFTKWLQAKAGTVLATQKEEEKP